MICPICGDTVTGLDGHHDHVRDVAEARLRELVAVRTPDRVGYEIDRFRRSGAMSRQRFRGEIDMCTRCNTVENAWKIRSNPGGGFLPKTFSLTPDEIGTIRAWGLGNDSAAVRDRIRRIWCGERRRHKRFRRLATRFADVYFADL